MIEAQRREEENSATEKWFGEADEQYARLKRRLESREVQGMEHGELEKLLRREGDELMRLLLQDHLFLRAWSCYEASYSMRPRAGWLMGIAPVRAGGQGRDAHRRGARRRARA